MPDNRVVIYKGFEHPRECVTYWYGCMLDSYNHYVADLYDRITLGQKRYVTDFKMRVDELAIALGEDFRVELPASYYKKERPSRNVSE